MNRFLTAIFSIFFSFYIQAQEWVNPSGKEVKTIFYQGMSSSQTQAAKYTGLHGFKATSGEHVYSTKAIDIIKDVWVKPEIDEVNLAPIKRNWKSLFFQPKNLAYNMWQRGLELISGTANKMYGVQVKKSTQESGHTVASHSVIISKINIAQGGDLASHRRRVDACEQELKDSDNMWMGVSRGAATTFQSAAALHKENFLNNTKLITLEGCFDTVEHVLRERHPWLLKSDYALNVTTKILEKITSFKRNGPSPLKAVQDFPKHIPVAFVTSLKDREVPAACTRNLVKKLVAAGHKNVYLLELKNSSHPRYMIDDENDKLMYLRFMHALYKCYNLPHVPAHANEQGNDLVNKAKEAAQSL